MMLGCSLCGWNDLSIYTSQEKLLNFIDSVIEISDLSCFELPFLPNLKYDDTFYKTCFNRVFSIHASKTVMEKNCDYIKKYFEQLKQYCNLLNCKYVVVHVPPKMDENKLNLAIEILDDITISIENTLNESFDISKKYFQKCKMTIDVSHLLYFKQLDMLYELSSNNISHFHIRGYSEKNKYVSLSNNKSKEIYDIIKEFCIKHNIPSLLEYPYHDVNELKKDLIILKEII